MHPLVSTICFIVLGVLSLTEISRYLNVETKTDLLVDQSHVTDKLTINIDIMFDRFPCDLLSVDVQDVMGTHHVNVQGSLVKQRFYAETGEVRSEFNAHTQHDRTTIFAWVREEIS